MLGFSLSTIRFAVAFIVAGHIGSIAHAGLFGEPPKPKDLSACTRTLTDVFLPHTLSQFMRKGEDVDTAELRLVVQWFLFNNGNQMVNRDHFRLWTEWADGATNPVTLRAIEAHLDIFNEIKREALEDDTSVLWRFNIQKGSRVISIDSLLAKKKKNPFISSHRFIRELNAVEKNQRLVHLGKRVSQFPALTFDEVLTIVGSFETNGTQRAAYEILRPKMFTPIESLEMENYFSQIKLIDESVSNAILDSILLKR